VSLPKIVSQEEWLQACRQLLVEEKAMTRARDALNTKRRELPMVRIEKDYVLDGPDGKASLYDLFDGRGQLIVQHFMFDPAWSEGCPSCSGFAEELSPGVIAHLRARNTNYVAVSRAPIDKIEAFRRAKGWTFPWYSSFGSDFNYDFHVTMDASIAPVMWNYRTGDELEQVGLGALNEGSSEQPGFSAFLRDGDDIFHTYALFARGAETVIGTYGFLDMTALGRQEEWEEPNGRVEEPLPNAPVFAS